MSPTFLWVSKFDVKLGSGGKIFKFTIFTWFFKNHAKSKVFQKHKRQRDFFGLFFKIWCQVGELGYDFQNYYFYMIFLKSSQK